MKRLSLNVAIWIAFLLLMSFQYLPKVLHEVGGIIWILAILLHLFWNRKWFKALLQGKWTVLRSLTMLVNILLIISSLTVLLSGICISNHVFKDMIPLSMQRNIIIHQLHVSFPYWIILLLGFHIGLHWQGLWQRFIKALHWNSHSMTYHTGCSCFMLILCIGGIYGSIMNRIGDRLQLKHIFATTATQTSWGIFILLLISIMGLYAVVAYTLQRKAKD